ncbi:MAG: NAD(P)H-dependent oxidoreductase subunit E [Planctomycetota bacterium]
MKTMITKLLQDYQFQRPHLLDMLWEIQNYYGYIPEDAIPVLSEGLKTSPVELIDTISFYHFFHRKPVGKYKIYLNKGIVAEMQGLAEVIITFQKETGLAFGETDPSGQISLHETSCIGMCDQEPACLINETVFTQLTPEKIKKLVQEIRENKQLFQMVTPSEDGRNAHPFLRTEIKNNIQQRGPVLLQPYETGIALKRLSEMTPEAVIQEIKDSGLRGRGGAGFSTGRKWEFCAKSPAEKRYIVCNADEGEPGTFKDRVLLTETPEALFEGMTIAGHAIQAIEGIIYLRAEYRYLKSYLNLRLKAMDLQGFPIRIQVGAGAYVCGEETALIESLEGKRGEPRYRPPFPTTHGYLGYPTVVNNVETFCTVPRILQHGANWYKSFGTEQSPGTRLLSVSGDCSKPGIYEIQWGLSLGDFMEQVGAIDCQAIQVGGPSGTLIPASEHQRKICYEDLATGGAMILFGKQRNMLQIVQNFMNFFVAESCGTCVPCRAGNVILRDILNKVVSGRGRPSDLDKMKDLGKIIKQTSRCGLGNTSPNPILFSLQYFRDQYESKIKSKDELFYDFDLEKAEAEFTQIIDSVKETTEGASH